MYIPMFFCGRSIKWCHFLGEFSFADVAGRAWIRFNISSLKKNARIKRWVLNLARQKPGCVSDFGHDLEIVRWILLSPVVSDDLKSCSVVRLYSLCPSLRIGQNRIPSFRVRCRVDLPPISERPSTPPLVGLTNPRSGILPWRVG